MLGGESAITGMPVGCDAEDFRTIADGDRHLGHIVYTGEWEAFDAIHPNKGGNGFKESGTFPRVCLARTAVETAVWGVAAKRQNPPARGCWFPDASSASSSSGSASNAAAASACAARSSSE